MEERRGESQTPDIYARVYQADRPEIFMKDSGHRLVGPLDDVGVRGDAAWNVPEPELAFVVYGGRIAGYTVGNDLSSRDIEGENPLYLTQAKVYDRSCAIGPCFVPAEDMGDPQALAISLAVERDGAVIFAGETNTAQMVRTCEDLCQWLLRHNSVPDGTVMLTGTGIVPDAGFTLTPGDTVRISIDGIGTLENGVRAV
jgi:2-dehydro-3-deoxy-D-arabinonate dehydratase